MNDLIESYDDSIWGLENYKFNMQIDSFSYQ